MALLKYSQNVNFANSLGEIKRKLSETINSLIKTERILVAANNTLNTTITLSIAPTLVINVYADGDSPVIIDRIGAPVGNSITLHFSEVLTTNTRLKIVYI